MSLLAGAARAPRTVICHDAVPVDRIAFDVAASPSWTAVGPTRPLDRVAIRFAPLSRVGSASRSVDPHERRGAGPVGPGAPTGPSSLDPEVPGRGPGHPSTRAVSRVQAGRRGQSDFDRRAGPVAAPGRLGARRRDATDPQSNPPTCAHLRSIRAADSWLDGRSIFGPDCGARGAWSVTGCCFSTTAPMRPGERPSPLMARSPRTDVAKTCCNEEWAVGPDGVAEGDMPSAAGTTDCRGELITALDLGGVPAGRPVERSAASPRACAGPGGQIVVRVGSFVRDTCPLRLEPDGEAAGRAPRSSRSRPAS